MRESSGSLIRPMQEADLELVFNWRNHINVRKFMFNQQEILWESHVAWFSSANADPSRCLLIAEENDLHLGFISFSPVCRNGVADWGFYTAPTAPRGSGVKLATVALDYAFLTLHLHKVCGQALAYNKGSRGFHNKLGFTHEGTLREQHYDGLRYHDVICFGLLDIEWTPKEGTA